MLDKTWGRDEHTDSENTLSKQDIYPHQYDKNSSSTTTPTSITVLEAGQPVLQIRKLSFRMKAPDKNLQSQREKQNPPITPQHKTTEKNSYSEIILSDRIKINAEIVELYANHLADYLLSGKEDAATSLGRTDAKVTLDRLLSDVVAKK